jgi:hypothetical protein
MAAAGYLDVTKSTDIHLAHALVKPVKRLNKIKIKSK